MINVFSTLLSSDETTNHSVNLDFRAASEWFLNVLTHRAMWRAGVRWEKSFHFHPSGLLDLNIPLERERRQSECGSAEWGAGCQSGEGGPPALGTSLEELLNGICPPASTEAEVSSGSSLTDRILRNAVPLHCGIHRTWRTYEQTNIAFWWYK